MQLNNGMGDVNPSQKDILIRNYSTIVNTKIAAIQGCNGIWLVVRSRSTNHYFSFLIDKDGLHADPVVSACGTIQPLSLYYYDPAGYGGRLVGSPDGSLLAAATYRGIELYNFEKCSGRVVNPRAFDTIPYVGLCFSPDNTKLYGSSREERWWWGGLPGRIYQFDISNTTAQAISNSKFGVLENPITAVQNFLFCTCGYPCYCDTFFSYIGDLRLGPDNKIYMLNSLSIREDLAPYSIPAAPWMNVPYPPLTAVLDSVAFHIIHAPNQPGAGCNPEVNAFTIRKNQGQGAYNMWLPLPLTLPPGPPDTLAGATYSVAACYLDSMVLKANEAGQCYVWDDSSTMQSRTVYTSGIYHVGYYKKDCTYQTDTFIVTFSEVPRPGSPGYSCLHKRDGKVRIDPVQGDTTLFLYQWYDQAGKLIGAGQSGRAFEIQNLPPGTFYLNISTLSGCDTTLELQVNELPSLTAAFDADSVACVHEPVTFLTNNTEPYIEWQFGDGSILKNHTQPEHKYPVSGTYTVLFIAENIEGCRDTGSMQIRVRDLNLYLTADRTVINRYETVTLQTAASDIYYITAWLPEAYFSDQHAIHQRLSVDSTYRVTVIAKSEHGCVDSAFITLITQPEISFPTAFTPNGDGKNDFFRPFVYGGKFTLHRFQIYDRWGKLIWEQTGSSDRGWDGNYRGAPCEVGTYFYVADGTGNTGNVFHQNGDVALIR